MNQHITGGQGLRAPRASEVRESLIREIAHILAEDCADPLTTLNLSAKAALDLVDICAMTVLSRDGETIEPWVIRHRTSELNQLLADMMQIMPSKTNRSISGRVIAACEPVLLSRIPSNVVPSDDQATLTSGSESVGYYSALGVPLHDRNGRAIGALSWTRRSRSIQPLDEADLATAVRIAELVSPLVEAERNGDHPRSRRMQ